MTPQERQAWQDFRAAIAEMASVDAERARLYLEGAALSLRGWARSVRAAREQRAKPVPAAVRRVQRQRVRPGEE